LVTETTIGEVERLLVKLGSGNHFDNMRAISRFSRFYRIEAIPEAAFFDLVFLQNAEVASIAPPGEDRRLRAVALRALQHTDARFSENWDLGSIRQRFALAALPLPPFVLRDTSGSERQHGKWYLQDGCHRALGYAMAVLNDEVCFTAQVAYCATEQRLG
jgi:hypothetical protein